MDFIPMIENLKFITDFKRKLRKKDYKNSTYIAKETAELFLELIKSSIDEKTITTQAQLILLVTYFGKIFTNIDQVQFCTGNTIKRIYHIIREEIKGSNAEDKTDFDKKQELFSEKLKDAHKNLQKMRNFNFSEIEEQNSLKNTTKTEKNGLELDEDNDEESSSEKNSSQKLYEIQKLKLDIPITEANKENILKRIDDLILEIDSISSSIIEQKELKDLINEGDTILTSNYSQQVTEIIIENAKTKKFQVLVAESLPLFNKKSQSENLIKKGIDTTIIDDNDIFDAMNKLKLTRGKVIIGARAFLVNGGLITYGSAYNICLAANLLSIPVIAVGGTTKLTPMYSFRHDLYNEFLSPDLIFGKNLKYEGDISGIQFNNPSLDYVPPELITMYVTNIGIINPLYLYRLFTDMYDQEDYEI
jgi:translation initiation factor eIF-2B subunit beta